MNNIHLYIGNSEVDFDESPQILYTYQVDDLTNPTIVKNSFSKTITLKGTRNNNHLFGHYWNVERRQVNSDNSASNVYFNATKKMDFKLYVGTELYESGYVKLDEVRRTGNDYEYDITLYGGLGDFFYNLSTSSDGTQMKLSNLNFDKDIDFTINLDTVKEAWNSLKQEKDDKWSVINFMPSYNGIPDGFDSDKMIIDTTSTNLTKSKTVDGKTYTTKDGWVMAELPDKMTEWETRDLRSYLQRPCIRMKEIIKACCKPENNGGYDVELDKDFFNANNSYWEKTWLTLPLIQTLEYDSGEQTVENATLITKNTEGDTEGYMYQELEFDLGDFPVSVLSTIMVKATVDPNFSSGIAYTSHKWFWNGSGDSYHSGWACYGSLFCQLLAFNGDTVIGASKAYNLTSPIRHNGGLWYGNNDRYEGGHKFQPYMNMEIVDLLGYFTSDGFTLENKTEPFEINFMIRNLTNNVTSLKMCYFWGASEDKLDKADYAYSVFNKTKEVSWTNHTWSIYHRTSPSYMTSDITYHNMKSVIGSTIGRTGTEVTKELLLSTEASPCDYLLSYCKMFGLYFSKEPHEKTIKIQTRKTFYDRTSVTDISKDIDYSKNVTITPVSFGTKYVEFNQEQDNSQYSKEYKTTKGLTYGCKVLNTGYEFNSDKKQLLDNNIIKSGVEGLEKSKYFTCYNNDNKVRPFFGYGMKYSLYNLDDSIEMIGSNATGSNLLGINEDSNLKYYDTFPKLQFHDNGKGTDGNNCLVFFSGFKSFNNRANNIYYFLTDDSTIQTQMNEGTPCWLFVSNDKDLGGKPVARRITDIPVFERYLTDTNGTTVKKSLDFGTAQEIYIPKYSIKEDVNIYSNFWKTYLEDLYDVNTKVLTVYVRLKDKAGYSLLRQFYWFENAVWRINKISDWNIGAEDFTKVEFIKVQDLNDYTSITQLKLNKIRLSASKLNVNPDGENISIDLVTENGGDWTLVTNSDRLRLSKTYGTGNDNITLSVPKTVTPSIPSYYIVTAIDNEGNTTSINLIQSYSGETRLSVTPSSLIIPSSGGNYDVYFSWVNQGLNTIDEGYFTGEVKGNVKLDDYNATIYVTNSAEPDAVISGKVFFNSGLMSVGVGIDQIPQSLSFGKEGGEYEFTFNYNTNVKYDNLPYWINMDGNKMKVLPNMYETARRSKITLSNGSSSADVQIYQDANVTDKVTPENLYFKSDGGLQYINVQLSNPWVIDYRGEWFALNVYNGDGAAIVGVSCGANGDEERSGHITVRDIVNGKRYGITLMQSGSQSVQSISVEPMAIEADAEGGEYAITFTYTNRNGDYVEVVADEGLYCDRLSWNGDVGTMRVRLGRNESVAKKVYIIEFKTSIGNLSVKVTQAGAKPYLNIDNTTLSFDSNGGGTEINVTGNVGWVAEISVPWLMLDDMNGDAGSNELFIFASPNTSSSRTGYIYFYNNDTHEPLNTITVNQMELIETLEVAPDSIEFDEQGGTATIEIKSNTNWTIEINE